MKDFDHMCSQPSCYKTENDCTIYEVQSRRGLGSFEVCGKHLLKREIDRAEAIVTAEGGPAEIANQAVLNGLQE